MPHMPRLEYSNAIYHIVARGIVDGSCSMTPGITIDSLKVRR